jgi:dGTPase
VGYSEFDRERYVNEPAKRPGRTEFARDRARVLHSAALRRLAAKTQVAVPWASDFPRTRLSHSLECAQVGREIGAALGADPDLVETACLAHDLGHPPFGHNGEYALNELAASSGGFEGNAQSFRILVRLEPKTISDQGLSAGLNLTRATLDASIKYPWAVGENEKLPIKFGVYQDDLAHFNWAKSASKSNNSSRQKFSKPLEAQIMDWSDDVAYSVHDFEDALQAGLISVTSFRPDIEKLWKLSADENLPNLSQSEFEKGLDRLEELSCWPNNFDGTHGSHVAMARLKDLTSQLIGRFAHGAELATHAKYGDAPLNRYEADLVVPHNERVEVAVLKAISAHYIFAAPSSQLRYERERTLIQRLFSALSDNGAKYLDRNFQLSWQEAASDHEKVRVIVDQIASLTDPAVDLLLAKIDGN